ncbi:MAG TPA: hypothetical protein VFT75_18440 [Nocardioidaceae bacterium]|nr:hypothetical protein [Nocardioidaceae bacterium]
MPRIATTGDATVWQCDRCGALAQSANAFELPPGWWQAHIERRTDVDEAGHGGKRKRGSIDACSKQCLTEAITYQNQHLVPYTEPVAPPRADPHISMDVTKTL